MQKNLRDTLGDLREIEKMQGLVMYKLALLMERLGEQMLNAAHQPNGAELDIQAAVSCENCRDDPEADVCMSCGRAKAPLS